MQAPLAQIRILGVVAFALLGLRAGSRPRLGLVADTLDPGEAVRATGADAWWRGASAPRSLADLLVHHA